jgi:hypothetical protein
VRCWSKKPTDRPTFCSLVAALQTLRDKEVSRKMLSAGATTAKEAQELLAKEAQERSDAEFAKHLQEQLLMRGGVASSSTAASSSPSQPPPLSKAKAEAKVRTYIYI